MYIYIYIPNPRKKREKLKFHICDVYLYITRLHQTLLKAPYGNLPHKTIKRKGQQCGCLLLCCL